MGSDRKRQEINESQGKGTAGARDVNDGVSATAQEECEDVAEGRCLSRTLFSPRDLDGDVESYTRSIDALSNPTSRQLSGSGSLLPGDTFFDVG